MQPDPLGLGAASLAVPQSLNMYSYVDDDLYLHELAVRQSGKLSY